MAEKHTPAPEITVSMRANKAKDTRPEMKVRRMVHAMGFRYRLHAKDLPGKPDLVFRSRRKVIFVHGCFWHQHPDPACKIARMPKSRPEFWRPKLERNRERDEESVKTLENSGWQVLVVWECSLRDPESTYTVLHQFLTGEGQCVPSNSSLGPEVSASA